MKKVPFQELIINHLSGALSPKEEADFRHMLEGNAEWKQEYESLKQIWDDSVLYDEAVELPDMDVAWEKFESRAFEEERGKVRKMAPWGRWMAIAAGLLILVVAVFWITGTDSVTDKSMVSQEVQNESLDVELVDLPDGSKVWLERGAAISYNEPFDRMVSLQGKALFEVTHLDENQRFVVQSGDSRTTVLGTVFSVDATTDGQVQVYVENGKVALESPTSANTRIELNPGEIGTFDKQTLSTHKSMSKSENMLAWKTKRLTFSDTRLEEILYQLESFYGADFEIDNPAILNCTYNTVYDQAPLDEVIADLSFGLNLSFDTLSETQFKVAGKGCE